MSGPKSDRAAYRRAMRWKKNQLQCNRAQVSRNGERKVRDLWTVKPVTPDMRPWITQDEINAAGQSAMEKNQ